MNNTTKTAVAIATQAQLPSCMVGEPGGGKTAFVYELGQMLQAEVVAFYGSCRAPEDIGGYPLGDPANKTISLIPAGEWQKKLLDIAVKATVKSMCAGILFLDELSCLNGAMQAAVMALIHEGRAGDVIFPKNIVRLAAMNPADQAAGGFDLAAPLANRLIHIPWHTDTEMVIQGFMDDWPKTTFPRLPENWEAHKRGAAALVASFFKRFPALCHAFPKEESKRAEPWPSPRSWFEFVVPSLAACESVKASEEVLSVLVAGSVGEGAALEFLGWRRNLDLLDPEDLLKDPKKFELYDRQDKTFATLNAVVAAALNNLTGERWTNAWKILNSCAKAGHVDLAAAACRSLAKGRKANLPNVSEYLKPFDALLNAAGV